MLLSPKVGSLLRNFRHWLNTSFLKYFFSCFLVMPYSWFSFYLTDSLGIHLSAGSSSNVGYTNTLSWLLLPYFLFTFLSDSVWSHGQKHHAFQLPTSSQNSRFIYLTLYFNIPSCVSNSTPNLIGAKIEPFFFLIFVMKTSSMLFIYTEHLDLAIIKILAHFLFPFQFPSFPPPFRGILKQIPDTIPFHPYV